MTTQVRTNLPEPAFRVVLPRQLNLSRQLSLEQISLIKSIGLNSEFLIEYVLSRWTDYIAELCKNDPWVDDHIYADIAEYIDGMTSPRVSSERSELDIFSGAFEDFKVILIKLKLLLEPYVNIVPNHVLDETITLVTHRNCSKFLDVLEFWPTEVETLIDKCNSSIDQQDI
jgi:hypothetical protein